MPATQVKRRRGTTAQNDTFAGAEGEITVDLENKELRVHTGDNKVGGYGLARKDFENITDKAKNISNWSSNVSNCITEIPQDIKLELNNRTLTLKAGSKVYVPNGAGVFDVANIQSDITFTNSNNNTIAIGYDPNSNSLYSWSLRDCYSGSSQPSADYALWYDTTNNLVKQKNKGVITNSVSFPIATITSNASQITSIDQVFNGFGYIGSTVFALPGVKGLIPDGRNADGTLRNTEFETSGVLTYSRRSKYSDYYIVLQGNEIANTSCTYDERNNYTLNSSGNPINFAIVGKISSSDNDGKISNFLVKTAFHAVDYNDSEYMAHQAMPSDKYINLTLGASGAIYTAPADGYVVLIKRGNYQQYITIDSGYDKVYSTCSYNGQGICLRISVKKGRNYIIWYDLSGETEVFRFIYANGAA